MADLLDELEARKPKPDDVARLDTPPTEGFDLLSELEGKAEITPPAPIPQEALPVEPEPAAVQPTTAGIVPPTPEDVLLQAQPEVFSEAAILEPAATVATGAIAQPVAGLIGLGTLAFGGDLKEATENIRSTQEALTFRPKTEAGKKGLQVLADAVEAGVDLANIPASGIAGLTELVSGEGLEKAAETIESVKTKGLGVTLRDRVLEETGDPIAAGLAQSIPEATLEVIGLKGLSASKLAKTKVSGNVAKAITQSAPDLQTIKNRSGALRKELDASKIKVKPKVYDKFVDNLQKKLKKEGIDPDLTPESNAVLNRLINDKGTAKSPSDLDTLRKVASIAAKSIKPSDARIGTIIIKELDDALDRLTTKIGGKFRETRALEQRAFKSQTITDMIEDASHTASGLENGLRIEARKILKSPKKRRGFTKDELDALRQIEQGTTAANAAKFLGKFGISEGQATSMLGASIGIGGGGAIGASFGPGGAAIGALTIPALGQIAKRTAQRITLNNAKFTDDLVRSGKNAKEVTLAYIKNTPIKDRNVSDLTDLLLETNIDASDIAKLAKSKSKVGKLVADSIYFADEIKRRAKQAVSVGLVTQPDITQENQ